MTTERIEVYADALFAVAFRSIGISLRLVDRASGMLGRRVHRDEAQGPVPAVEEVVAGEGVAS